MRLPIAVPAPLHSGAVRKFGVVCATGVLLVAVVVLTGWMFDFRALQSFVPGYVTMKVNTAVGLGLSAVGLLLLAVNGAGEGSDIRLGARGLIICCGAVVAVLGSATVAEYMFGRDLGIDQLVWPAVEDASLTSTPGRMAAVTALALTLIGASLVGAAQTTRVARRMATWFAVGAGALALSALVGYAYRGIPVTGLGQGIQIAIHTAVALVLLSAGIFALSARRGLLEALTSPRAGGVLARRMLPVAILIPLALGAVRGIAVSLGLDALAGDSALVAVLTMVAFGLVIWRMATQLDVADRNWRSAEADRLKLVSDEQTARAHADAEHRARIAADEARTAIEGHAAELSAANAALAMATRAAEDARSVAETTLQEQDALLGSMPDVVLILDRDGTCLKLSGNTQLLVASPEVMLGRCMHDVLPSDRAGSAVATIRRVLDTGRKAEFEYSIEARDRQLRLVATVTRLTTDTVLWMSRDVTDWRSAEERLVQSQKLDAVGQLAGGIAHDFNNMLTVITTYAGLLLQELTPSERVHADVSEIKDAADRAAALTRQLLAFSRQQALEPGLLDLNTTVSGLENMLRRVLPADIAVVTKLDPALGCVHADAGQLEQVLMNLAVNARDAMPDGGTLLIETTNTQLDPEYEPLPPHVTAGSYVVLTVSDDGVGMPRAVRDRVFEPFFTTKGVGKGTGLGLATAYGVVKQSGGHIGVYSELGEGTTFRILLPQVAPGAEPAVERARRNTGAERGAGVVLLVEDEPQVRAAARRILESVGYTPLVAQHGADAVRLFTEHTSTVDVVLTDMIMPDMNGAELASVLRALRPELPVVFMSGYTEEGMLRRGLPEGEVLLLPKPFTPESLTRKIREALQAA